MRRWLAPLLLVLIGLGLFLARRDESGPQPEEHAPGAPPPATFEDPDYAGVAVCKRCHARETDAWEQSPHGRHATPLAKPRSPFDAALGSTWMQAYLKRDERGFHRILSRCFDLKEKRWRPVTAVLDDIRGRRADLPSITEAAVAERSFEVDCAGCHASGVKVRLDPVAGRMVSSWRDLAIDCEACHGPGRAHAEAWANLQDGQPLPRLESLPLRVQTGLCARCHGGPPTVGDFDLEDAAHFLGAIEESPVVEADGSAIGQLYQFPAFRRSPCHLDGGLGCSDCHDPHGPGQRASAHVDGLCTPCHEQYASRRHTHHDPVSEAGKASGARCIDCHMPQLREGLTAHQRDHRIGIPLPASPYVPDACSTCHADHDKGWSDRAWRRWWGDPPTATLEAIEAVHRARLGEGGPELDAMLRRALKHPDPYFRVAASLRLGDSSAALGDALPGVRAAGAEVASEQGHTDALEQARKDPESLVRAQAMLGLVAAGREPEPSWLPDLRRYARLNRNDAAASRLIARIEMQAGRPEEAVVHLEQAVVFQGRAAEVWWDLAAAYAAAMRPAEAAGARDRARSLRGIRR